MWIAALVIIILILGVLLFMLFIPIIIEINTIKKIYQLRISMIGSIDMMLSDKITFQLKLFGIKKTFAPFDAIRQQKEENTKSEIKTGEIKNISTKKLFSLIRSFKVKRIYVNIDTKDYIQNALLFPLFFLLNTKKRQLSINYFGRNELILVIENNIYRILQAFFK